MIRNKKWIIGILCSLFGLLFTACIEDDEEQSTCVPVVPVESDLVDSWIIEYNQYVQKAGDQIVKEQDFTKQEGQFLNINKDYTWNYDGKLDGKEVKTSGTWNYKDGILYLTNQNEEGVSLKHELQVFRLCSMRLRVDFKYQKEIDGVMNEFSVITVLLRNK